MIEELLTQAIKASNPKRGWRWRFLEMPNKFSYCLYLTKGRNRTQALTITVLSGKMLIYVHGEAHSFQINLADPNAIAQLTDEIAVWSRKKLAFNFNPDGGKEIKIKS